MNPDDITEHARIMQQVVTMTMGTYTQPYTDCEEVWVKACDHGLCPSPLILRCYATATVPMRVLMVGEGDLRLPIPLPEAPPLFVPLQERGRDAPPEEPGYRVLDNGDMLVRLPRRMSGTIILSGMAASATP